MNFYDKINELVKFFKETEEYKEFIYLKTKIKKDEENYKLLKEFKSKQTKQQMDYMTTGKVDESLKKELENLYSLLIRNDDIIKLLEQEMRINIMLADMQKTIGQAIKEIVEF